MSGKLIQERAYLLIDCSGSMGGDKITQAKQGATGFAEEAFRKGYKVGLIQFSSYASALADASFESRWQTYYPMSRPAKRIGIEIQTIGTDDADRAFLERLATRRELTTKVEREKLQQAITSMAKLLPG